MKRIIQAMVVAALFTGTQAMAEDAMIVLPSQATQADGNAGNVADSFPGSAPEMIVLESQSTNAGTAQEVAVSAFPGTAREDPIVVESMSTYADQFVAARTTQASAAAEPALSE